MYCHTIIEIIGCYSTEENHYEIHNGKFDKNNEDNILCISMTDKHLINDLMKRHGVKKN